jgi:acetoin:2,6-dichlorophenolindophenol oxidoreductase subunit beta
VERRITFRQAINEALTQEMERDKRVVIMGEDVVGGSGTDGAMDAWGGVLGVTKGLWGKFGDRIMDTPITESAFVGAAIGAATAGLRPVVELMFVTPVVVRTMFGAGFRAAAQHSQCLYPIFTHIPGLKCVIPSSPYDAKGLLIQSIRDDDPVMFFEHKLLYSMEGEVPEEPYTLQLGEANVMREGDDVTIVSLGRMVHTAAEAAAALSSEGIDCEVIDLRTTSPLDEDSILESVERTGRLVVVDEASPRCNIATDISAAVAQKRFARLKAPIQMVTPPHTPVPFSDALEDLYIPNASRIASAVRDVVRYKA